MTEAKKTGKSIWLSQVAYNRLLKTRRIMEEVMNTNISLSKVGVWGVKLAYQEALKLRSGGDKKND